jgi:uracil phosphoribosyltransferase
VFRKLVTDIGTLLGYEATKDLGTKLEKVSTPLCDTEAPVLSESIALVPVLRAGLGMVDGLLQVIPDARVIHIGIARNEETLQPVQYYYSKLPKICDRDVAFVLDPMLATGGTAIATINQIKKWGVKRIKFLCILASVQGIKILHEAHPDVDIHACGIDQELNEHGYIVPGLGDAGDRQYNG